MTNKRWVEMGVRVGGISVEVQGVVFTSTGVGDDGLYRYHICLAPARWLPHMSRVPMGWLLALGQGQG